jgi:hypothetical protein
MYWHWQIKQAPSDFALRDEVTNESFRKIKLKSEATLKECYLGFGSPNCNYVTQRHRQYHRSTHNDIVRYRATDPLNTIAHVSLESLYKDWLMSYLLIIPFPHVSFPLIHLILLFCISLKALFPNRLGSKICPRLPRSQCCVASLSGRRSSTFFDLAS